MSADDPCDNRAQTAYGDLGVVRLAALRPRVGGCVGWEYFLEPFYENRRGTDAPLLLLESLFITCSPGVIQPGLFFVEPICGLEVAPPDKPLEEEEPLPPEETDDQFHDSDLGDIYDLYNACNGAMDGDLLDVRKLDELSPDEKAALDVKRLREVWEHTNSGCDTCANIVRTLNAARGPVK